MRPRIRGGEQMKTRISALMDGELEGHEIEETLRALRRSGDLRRQWCDCQLIGAALRGERELDIEVTVRVMSAIDLEPTVMAMGSGRVREWRRSALALAASAAGIALVTWLALAPNGEEVQRMADRGQNKELAAQARSMPRLQEYLVAHQAHAHGGAIVGGARNIRTVAASDEGR